MILPSGVQHFVFLLSLSELRCESGHAQCERSGFLKFCFDKIVYFSRTEMEPLNLISYGTVGIGCTGTGSIVVPILDTQP